MNISTLPIKVRHRMVKKKQAASAKKAAKPLGNRVWSVFRGALLFCLCFVLLYPLLYMLSISFRDIQDLFDVSVTWIPKHFTLHNIKDVLVAMHYPEALGRTVFISCISSLLLITTSSLAGYGFARFQFKGRNLMFAMVIFTIIVPPQTYIMPMYLQYRYFDFFGLGKLVQLFTGNVASINLLGSVMTIFIPALLGSGLKAGLYIYIFRQFFRGLPKELEDAAYIDGCGFLHTFFTVMIPNAVPAYVTAFLFSFVWYWNDYLFAGMFLVDNRTLPISLIMLESLLYNATKVFPDVNVVMTRMQAGSLLMVAPLIVIYTLLQRYFTESIERTGIVG